ncbi:G-protein coupled receptor [Leptospira mayottensis]|nr:G-protein coupled receptor [Leptospira mayottensis]
MKQNKNQLQRERLTITVFAITALFLVTNCKKEKDGQ